MQTTYRANGFNYTIIQEKDGWYSIYEYNDGLPLKPLIQAKTLEHAHIYCEMREPAPAGLKRLV